MTEIGEEYTLVVCEKPDVAKRVTGALAEGRVSTIRVGGATVFKFARKGERFAVCSAQGHLYGVSDPFDERSVYPVFDAEWYPGDLVNADSAGADSKIEAISQLAKHAKRFVNACDYDVEGETIAFNVLKYACSGKEGEALRAKFSTLTDKELVAAFSDAKAMRPGMASAGRARHLLDFVWGVNLSRALSQSVSEAGRRYRTVSMGRVQGPTLKFVVDRESEIRTFVPSPYWTVKAEFEKGRERFSAQYSRERVGTRREAKKIISECSGEEGKVTAASKKVYAQPPPPPFNIGDLQKEAYRVFGFPPHRTMEVAERLYLDALISYPRTSSQKLPPSIDYGKIVGAIGRIREYAALVSGLPKSSLKPVQGAKDDPAHPAIHPTGQKPNRGLGPTEARVFDMVIRRFLSAFAPSAKRETSTISMEVAGHEFRLDGRHTTFPGWLRYYGKYSRFDEIDVPELRVGDAVAVAEVASEEKFEQQPRRFNQGSLLERMEQERIGTKATRADVISTLVARGYISGDPLTASDVGFAVIDAMERHAPEILSTEFTRRIESELEAVESGAKDGKDLLRQTISSLADQLLSLQTNKASVGDELRKAAASAEANAYSAGTCPVCKTGTLRIIKSRKSGKRFVGCTNYANGCRASAPLPQKGVVRTTTGTCRHCSWPVVYVLGGRRPWRLCVNANCPTKRGRSRGVRSL